MSLIVEGHHIYLVILLRSIYSYRAYTAELIWAISTSLRSNRGNTDPKKTCSNAYVL
jgi:hypothetical protein